MQMDERILAEGCREGDGAARRELYDRFAGRLMAVCMRYAGDRLGMTELDEGRVAATVAEPAVSDVEQVPREVLLRFVSELPEGYRAVFNLYCIEEYSHREIARMLGINEKSSSSQLFRARALLARKIRAYLESH